MQTDFRQVRAAKVFHYRVFLVLWIFAGMQAWAVVDLDEDGFSDIWELKYGATGLPANGDADGDGKTNAEEAAAGTDPFSADSVLRVTSMTADVSGVHLSWSGISGKLYQIQSTSSLKTPNWQNEGSAIRGTDGKLSATCATSGANKFYRVIVQEMDSDGDGITDWEELQIDFAPNSGRSAGLTESDDLARLTTALKATNTVTIVATDSNATEDGLKPGVLTITRTGNLNPITVTYVVSGSAKPGTDYQTLSGSVKLPLGVNTATIQVIPKADTLVESPEAVIVSLNASTAYSLGAPSVAAVIIADQTQANGTGLLGQYWNEISSGSNAISTTNPAKFSGSPVVSHLDTTVNFNWPTGSTQGTNSPAVGINTAYYSSRWTGEVLPQYSQVYTFYLNANRVGRVWVNGQLIVSNWPPNTVTNKEYSGTIELVAGVRYPIVVEEYALNTGGAAILSWQSANQVKQLIPTTRMFANIPPQILSATQVTVLKNSGPYTYQIAASGSPTSYSAANLPPGWTLNTVTGVISGSPAQPGEWQIPLTATNANGAGSAILILDVIDTQGAMTREVWNGGYSSISALPLSNTPDTTGLVASMEGPQSSGTNYGSRLRGYVFAPTTGAYQFWVTGDDAAELWISNDEEPVNLFLHAATSGTTGYRDWSNANVGKSPLLWLKAGQRYYTEVRHFQTTGSDHVSVGWFKPGDIGTGLTPTEVVPGYALSPWVQPSASASQEGTLFTTSLTPQGASSSSGYGLATLRLSADETTAILSVSYANLTGPVTMWHVHDDQIPGGGMANIAFDLDEPGVEKQADGSIVWHITAVANLSAADVVQGIKTGHTYFNIHTAQYPGGEIKGYFNLQAGSQTFTPPAAPPAWTDDHTDTKAAARFLLQATFGPSSLDVALVKSLGYSGWIDDQFNNKPITLHLSYVEAHKNVTDPHSYTYLSNTSFNSWWLNSITAPDQLRQRVAFALSEIMVISSNGVLENFGDGITDYYDTLLRNAFGNYRDILKAVTLHPAMGNYLDMRGNDKPNLALGLHPNENYAREIQQLFSIGLNRLHPDGSLLLNSKGLPVQTYDQDVIVGFAHAFTGWNYNQADSGSYLPTSWSPARDWTHPMKAVPSHHFTGQKRILNNVVLAGLPSIGGVVLNPYATHTTAQIQNAAYQALPMQELDATHDALFNHPNCGPFICRQLIQRLVTSTPSRGYLYRVVQAFNDNGSGVRGDMKAVLKAILLDYEARSSTVAAQQGFGKQREPLLKITALARAFPAPPSVVGTYSQADNVIAINTTSAHRLATGNTATIDFTSGTPSSATDGSYSVTVTGSTSFTVASPEYTSCTYTQSGTTVTVKQKNPHYLADRTGYVSNSVAVWFKTFSGTPKPTDGFYPIATYVDPYSYTVQSSVSVSGTVTGSVQQVVYRGEYNQTANTISVTTTTTHGLTSGASVYIRFYPITGHTDVTQNGTFTITVVDDTHFTITALDSATRSGTVALAPTGAITASRTGNLALAACNWMINSTDNDIQQTPLNSPTVFNFFEPDFQFGGTLSEAGLITPEFQLTSETTVIGLANFIYNGIAFPSSSSSIFSSFRNGAGNITMDFGPWMQAGPGGVPWTNDVNLDSLIDQFDTLLTPKQLSDSAKAKIKAYVISTANISYNHTTPTDQQKRDRIRALVHLIATSADFSIQK